MINMPSNYANFKKSGPATMEKVVGALCYLTGGIAGIIYIIISRSSYQSEFFRFHFLQAIVISIISLLLGWCVNFFYVLVPPGLIPVSAGLVQTVVSLPFFLLAIYGLVSSLLGKYCEIPWLSNVVRNQMR